MRLRHALIAAIVLLCGSCIPAKSTVSEDEQRTLARASLYSMIFGVIAAGMECDAFLSAALKSHSESRLEHANEIGQRCVKLIIPPRDAQYMALSRVDPWASDARAAVGCAGRATRYALEAIRDMFAAEHIAIPVAVHDGIRMGASVEPMALDSCDPRYPTTTVRVTVTP